MKGFGIAVVIAAVLAGCGGGSSTQKTSSPPISNPQSPISSAPQAPQPTATTNTPPTKHRTKPQPLEDSKLPLKVGGAYTCKGQRLKTISAAGPVKVQPKVVKPGQPFTVTITDTSAKVALVSLTGVAPKPIQAQAKERGGNLAAALKMPGYATCGNKLLEIEGDLSAEAYVGVSS